MTVSNQNIIKILPDFIANQIAAGEVVQRPESVVKELIENAIDAGATEITVLVRNAGKSLIHVIDNGMGMSKEDLELSILRHATSKVSSQKDLESIYTLGFRGEALASISSVAHLEIVTRNEKSQLGFKLTAEPNKREKIEEVSANIGTQILVKNLFYNVPARRKFLKSNLTEFKHISETMLKFAISNHKIRFTFYDDDNLIFDLNPSDLETRLISTLGNAIKDLLIPISYQEESIKICGFIGKPFLAKNNSSNQYLFLNGRIIKNRYLNHAVLSCYEELLQEKKYPFYVLFLDIDPNSIDINVHPQKNEVKFENDRLIYNVVKSAILGTLREVNLIPEFKVETELNYVPFQIEKDSEDNKIAVNRYTGEIISKDEQYNNSKNNSDRYNLKNENRNKNHYQSDEDISQIFEQDAEISFEHITIDDRFVIIKEKEHLLIIYVRRALQRIYFELLVKAFQKKENKSQDLLFPEEISLEKKLILLLKQNDENLKDFGFLLEYEKDKVIVQSVPEIVQFKSNRVLIERIATNLYDSQRTDNEKLHEYIAKIIAISIKLNESEYKIQNQIKKLYNELFRCDNPHHSPTGKLTSYTISYSELEKKFRL